VKRSDQQKPPLAAIVARQRGETNTRIDLGRVFDRTVSLNQVPEGYRAMNEREAIKVMVKP
jgi:threonine dehydrogenase-like Zn-dependent dehydrogenase